MCVLISAFTAEGEWEPSDIMDAKPATATAAELVRDLRGIFANELLLLCALLTVVARGCRRSSVNV